MTEYKIQLDVRKPVERIRPQLRASPVVVRQGFAQSVRVSAVVNDGGSRLTLDGCTVTLRAQTLGGMLVTPVVAEVLDGMACFQLPDNIAAERGAVWLAYLEIADGQTKTDTENFSIQVVEGVDIAAEEAAAYRSHLDQLMERMDAEVERITAQHGTCAASAHDAAQSAAQSAGAAERAESAAQSLRRDAEAGLFDGKDGKDGEPFTYDDFTPEQLASLTGPQGPEGERGQQGVPGKDGSDGHTPVRGTDYFTESDKAEMVQGVLASLPAWTGGEY